MSEAISPDQRFTLEYPCPVCGGHKDLPSGVGARCAGFISKDGKYAYCQRELFAGDLPTNENTMPPTYRHTLVGECGCGTRHERPSQSNHHQHSLPTEYNQETGRRDWRIEFPDGTLAGIHRRIDYLVLKGDGSGGSHKNCVWLGHNGRSPSAMPLYGVRTLRAAAKGSRVYVTEGEKACDALTNAGILAVGTVTGAGGIPCDDSLRVLMGYEVVLWPDNDDIGQKHMARIAARLYARGMKWVGRVAWTDAPEKGDAADYFHDDLHTPDSVAGLVVEALNENPNPFRLLTEEEVENLPPTAFLIDGVLPETGVGMLYGPSGAWKSFALVSLAMSIRTGTDWFGHKVKPGNVVLIVGEGRQNIGKRLRAWKLHYGEPDPTLGTRIWVLNAMVHLLDEGQLSWLVKTIKEQLGDEKPHAIFIDTLALSMVGGHENDTKDTNQLMANAEVIRNEFNNLVLFAHHTGYDQSHMRGNTSLYGSADVVVKVEPTTAPKDLLPGMLVRLLSDKERDWAKFSPLYVTTELETWAKDEEGKTEGSLVLVPFDGGVKPKPLPTSPPPSDYSDGVIKSWRALVKLCGVHEDGATMGEWVRKAADSSIARTTVFDARSRLVKDGWVQRTGDKYAATTPGSRNPKGEGWTDRLFGPADAGVSEREGGDA